MSLAVIGLAPEQIQAAQRLGQDVCVVAGPGSGKTSVLIERFRWLVEVQRVAPSAVLAITFTEKAAAEIQQRLAQQFAGDPQKRRQVERAWVSTIHGFCARLVREHSIEAGVDPEFIVLEAPRSGALLAEAAEDALNRLFEQQPERLREILEALDVSSAALESDLDLAGSLIDIYEAMRVAGVTMESLRAAGGPTPVARIADALRAALTERPFPLTANQAQAHADFRAWAVGFLQLAEQPPGPAHFAHLAALDINLGHLKKNSAAKDAARRLKDEDLEALRGWWLSGFHAPQRQVLAEALGRLDEGYRARKRRLSALDFSDLEETAIELLRRRPAVLARLRAGFEHILMDELQDTNPLQWRLLDLLRVPNRFFAVGDINQSIYAFRHAEPGIFTGYRDGLAAGGGSVDELRNNYRSRGEILAAAQAILGDADGIEPRALVAARPYPPKDAPSVELIAGGGTSREQAEQSEACWVARRIRELEGALLIGDPGAGRPARFGDCVVLARSLNALAPIQRALDDFQIPWEAAGGNSFYEAREVRDLTALLAVIANPLDEISLAGVLRSPLAGASDETLLRLKLQGGLAEALEAAAASEFELRDFQNLLAELRAMRSQVSPDRLLIRALDAGGYEMRLEPRARANVEKLLGMLRSWHEREPRPLAAVLEELSRRRTAESEAEAPPASARAVRLMTIHQAKGLEFPIVFLAGLHRGVDRRGPSLRFSPAAGLGVRWRDPATGKGAGDSAWQRVAEDENSRSAAEENRLLYVAMTRAQEHLVLSFSRTDRAKSSWPEMVALGLGLDLDAVNDERFRHRAPGGFDVEVICSNRLADNPFPPPPAAGDSEAVLAGPPLVEAQYDSTVPVTHVAEFAECPRKYYLAHYVGLEVETAPVTDEEAPRRKGPGGADLGAQVHRILAGLPAPHADPEAERLAAVFQSSEMGARASRASRLEREFDFLIELDDVVLRGQMDLWFEENGERVLVDYKSDQFDPDVEPERVAAYALQLRLYALGLERLDGRLPDRALLFFLRPGKAVPVALDAASLAAARSEVRRLREAQSKVEFGLRPGEQCLRCAYYRGPCPVGERGAVTLSREPSSFPGLP